MNITPITLVQDYNQTRLETLEIFERRESLIYLDSANPPHPTIGIGFDLTVDDNLERVLRAMGVDPNDGANGQNLFNQLQAIVGGNWAANTQPTLRLQVNQVYTNYRIAEGLQAAGSPITPFSMTDAEIENAFDAIVEVREQQLHQFFEEYNIDLDGNAANNNATDFYSRMPRSTERLALLSLLFNSRTHPTNIPGTQQPHPNAGMPTTLTSGTRRGGNLVDALVAGDRTAAWFEIRFASNGDRQGGLAKRRYYESQIFGLYDDPANPTADEAQDIISFLLDAGERIYATYRGVNPVQNNLEYMLAYETDWGLRETQNDRTRSQTRDAIRDYNLNGDEAQLRWGDVFRPIATELMAHLSGLSEAQLNALGIAITGDVNLGFESQWTSGATPDAQALIQPTYRTLYQISPTTNTDPALAARELGGINDLLIATNSQNSAIAGLYGNDVLIGNEGDDTLYGGYSTEDRRTTKDNGNDVLFGQGGDDTLYGHGGNDQLFGGEGNDTLYGGEGNDQLSGGQGDDTYYLTEGSDEVTDNGRDLTPTPTVESSNDTYFVANSTVNTTSNGARVVQIEDNAGADEYNIGTLDNNILTIPPGYSGTVTITDNGLDNSLSAENEANDIYRITGDGTINITDISGTDRYIIENFTGTLNLNDSSFDASDWITVDGTPLSGYLVPVDNQLNTWRTPNGVITVTRNSPITITTENGGKVVIGSFDDGEFGVSLGSGAAEESIGNQSTEHVASNINTDPIEELNYRIVKGDSVSTIMKRMNLDFYDANQRDTFLSVNAIQDADLIFAGQTLVNPFHPDFEEPIEPEVTPADLATPLPEAEKQDPLANDSAEAGNRISSRSFDYSLGDYGIDVDQYLHGSGDRTTDVEVNLGSRNRFVYDENIFSNGEESTDVELRIGDDRFVMDEKVYADGEQARDIELVIDDDHLIIKEELFTNGQETRDIDLAIGDDNLVIDQTVYADGRKDTDFSIEVDGDYLKVSNEAFSGNRETRDVELRVGENSLKVDEKVYQNNLEARDIELRVGEDHLIVKEDAFTNGELTRDVDFKVGENRLVVDETIDNQGRELTDFRIDAGDDQILVDEQVAANGEIVTDTLIKIGENSLVIDKDIDAQNRATDFIRIEAGDDYLELDENVNANGEITTNYDVKIDAYRIDRDVTVDSNGNTIRDTLIEAGSDSIKLDQQVDAAGRKTQDTTVQVGDNSLQIDQNYEGPQNNSQLTSDYDLKTEQDRLVIRNDIDSNGNQTRFTRLDIQDDFIEVDENVEANGEITTDIEAQLNGDRFSLKKDINASGQLTESLALHVDNNRLEVNESVAANGSIVTDLDLTLEQDHIRIDNDFDDNGNATRDLDIQVGESQLRVDEQTASTSVQAEIDGASVSVEQSTNEAGSQDTDIVFRAGDDALNLQIDAETNSDGVSTDYIRAGVGENYIELDENIEADGSVTTDLSVGIKAFQLNHTVDIDSDGNRQTTTSTTLDNDSLTLTSETQQVAGTELTSNDAQIIIDDNRLVIDETIDVDQVEVSRDIEISLGDSRIKLDESEDGTNDVSIVQGENSSLFLDRQTDGTTDTSIVHGQGTISIDENSDGTTNKTIRYTDTNVQFNESLNNGNLVRVVTIVSGASTIVLDASGIATADIQVDDTHITQDADGNIQIELADNQGIIQIQSDGELDITLRDGDSVITLNSAGELIGNIVKGDSTLNFDNTGAFNLNLIDEASSVSLDNNGTLDLTLSDGVNTASFSNNDDLSLSLATDSSSVTLDDASGLNINVNVDGSQFQFDEQAYSVNLTDGTSRISADSTGDVDVSLVDGDSQLTFNEEAEFEAILSNGASRIAFNDQGELEAALVEGSNSATFDNQGNYQIDLNEGANRLFTDDNGNVIAELSDGENTIRFNDDKENNTRDYSIALSDGANSLAFDQTGALSATASQGDSSVSLNTDQDSTEFSVSSGEIALNVGVSDDSSSLSLNAGDSSVGVEVDADSAELTLNHEGNTLAINDSQDETSVTITDANNNQFSASASEDSSSVALTVDGDTLSYSESENSSEFSLASGDIELGIDSNAEGTTYSLNDNRNNRGIEVSDDGNGLDYELTSGSTSFSLENNNESTIVSATEGQNSLSFDTAAGTVAATIGEISLSASNADGQLAASLSRGDQSLTVTDNDQGIGVSLQDGDNRLSLERGSDETRLIADNGNQELVIRDDGDGVDVSVEDGNIIIGVENEDADTIAFIEVNGLRFDEEFNPSEVINRIGSTLGNIFGGAVDAFQSVDGSIFEAIGRTIGDLADDFSNGSLFDVAENALDGALGLVGEYQRELGRGLARFLVDGLEDLGVDPAAAAFIEDVATDYFQEIFSFFDPEDKTIDFSEINAALPATAATFIFDELISGELNEQLEELGVSESVRQEFVAQAELFFTDQAESLFNHVSGNQVDNVQFNWQGAAGSILAAVLVDELGLEGEIGLVVQEVGSQALTQLITNISTGAELTSGLSLADFQAASVNFIAAYVGSQIGMAVYDVKSKEGAIGASLGASIGAQIGTAILPVIGTVIGAAIGYIIGGIFGDLFGGTPRSGADVIYDHDTGEFEVTNVWKKDGGSKSTARQLAKSAADTLNALLDVVGGEVLNDGVIYGGTYGLRGDSLTYRPEGRSSPRRNFDNPTDLINFGVIQALDDLQVAGGNLYAKRAIFRDVERYMADGEIPDDALEILIGYLSTAVDYQNYIENADEINELIRTAPSSAFAITWIATLEQAQALGLTRRFETDHIGGWQYLLRDENAVVDTQFGRKKIGANYADTTLRYDADEGRVIEITRADDTVTTIDDLVQQDTKRQVQYISTSELQDLITARETELAEDIQNLADAIAEDRIASSDVPLSQSQIQAIRSQAFSDARLTLVPQTYITLDGTLFVASKQGLVDADSEIVSSVIINGSDGDDVIASGDLGNDVFGGAGNDRITGGKNADWLFGGTGNDTLSAVAGNNNALFGESGNDTVLGGAGSDWLSGGSGSDTIRAGAGDDVIDGGSGNDQLEGQGGDDTYLFRRGDGQDTISDRDSSFNETAGFAEDFTGFNVWLARFFDDGRRVRGAEIGGGTDTIEFGENITLNDINIRLDENTGTLFITLLNDAGERTNDVLSIENWDNSFRRIEKLRFNDGQEVDLANFQSFILGTEGNDALIGTDGADFIHGGSGDDNISALAGDDVAIGGLGNDMVSGDDDNDLVIGGDGSDNLYGGADNDIISGDKGNDAIAGGTGDDIVSGGEGNDNIRLGAGNDMVVFGRGDGHDTLADSWGESLARVAAFDNELTFEAGYDWTDSAASVGVWDFENSRVADGFVLTQGENANQWVVYELRSNSTSEIDDLGEDILEFKLGVSLQDIRVQTDGNDLLLGIEDTGRLEQNFADLDDTIRLMDWLGDAGAAIETFRIFGLPDIDATSFSGWFGGDNDNDNIDGTVGRDWITSGAGQDVIRAGDGDDIIKAGAGDDYIEAGAGADIIFGGQGFDTLSYESASSGVSVNLNTLSGFRGDATGDKIDGVEYLVGSDFDDVLIGDAADNEFTAGLGNDRVVGGEGNDRYIFRRGDGELRVAEANQDNGIVGAGEDILQFGDDINPGDLDFLRVGLDLEIRIAGTDDLIVLENWFLDESNRVETLLFVDGGAIDIRFQSFEPGSTEFIDWVAGDDGDNVLEGLGGNDMLSGRAGNDILNGGAGDDFMLGGEGADQFNGGAGQGDTVAYYDSTEGVSVDLGSDAPASGGTAQGDTFNSVENLIGSRADDELRGNQFNNKINGGMGDDLIVGEGGADNLQGADGNDLIQGGSGQDNITGNGGEDEIYGGTGDDILRGGDDADIIFGNEGRDELDGGDGANQLYGGADNDLIRGGLDSESLFGGAGDDELRGNDGDDTLRGGSGRDALFGESGNDTIYGEQGVDYIAGGAGDDTIYGGTDDDVVEAGIGDDVIIGGSGNDLLAGGEGDDTLTGGQGSDFLIGDEGNDILMGGEDTDFYIFAGGFGQDTIIEAADRQALDEVVFADIGFEQLWFSEEGNDLIISVIGTEDSVRIENFARFRINSDTSGELLDRLNEAFAKLAPIESLRVDTSTLSVQAVGDLADAMSGIDQPDSIEDIPTDVIEARNTLWQPEELTAGEARVDFAPVLTNQQFSLEEGGQLEIALQASDQNPDDLLSYEIIIPPALGEFSAVGETTALDSETVLFNYVAPSDFSGQVSAVVRVTDISGLSDDATLSFTINPIDDAGSVIDQIDLVTTEDSSVSGDLVFIDEDSQFFDYQIAIGDETFDLDDRVLTTSQGSVEFTASGRFIYTPFQDISGVDNFSISLTDPSGRSYETQVNVEIFNENDAPTVGLNPQIIDIGEIDAADFDGVVSGNILFSDLDIGDSHSFTLLDSVSEGSLTLDSTIVSIDASNYAIGFTYTANDSYDGNDGFSIRVRDDSGDLSSFVDIDVQILDNPPEFNRSAPNPIVITEEQSVANPILSLMPTDASQDGFIEYSLSNDFGGLFDITSTGNIIWSSAVVPDFEDPTQQTEYEFNVIAGIPGRASAQEQVRIQIEDINEAPNTVQFRAASGVPGVERIDASHVRIAESLAIGTAIGTVFTTDPDTNPDFINFAIRLDNASDLPFTLTNRREIDGGFEYDVETTQTIDADTAPFSYSLSATATDSGDSTLTSSSAIDFTVDIAAIVDEPPVIIGQQPGAISLTVDENAAELTNIEDFRLRDDDLPSDIVSIALDVHASETEDRDIVLSRYEVSPNEVTTQPGQTPEFELRVKNNAEIDYENAANTGKRDYLTLVVTDSNNNVTTQDIEIAINNVDEVPTGLSWSENTGDLSEVTWIGGQPRIGENTPANTAVGLVNVSDPDEVVEFRDWVYSMDGNNAGGRFTINPETGLIRVGPDGSTPLDVGEAGDTYTVRVRVTDADAINPNDPDSYFEQEISIDVTNENSAPTIVGGGFTSFATNEFTLWTPERGGPSESDGVTTVGAYIGKSVGNIAGLFSDADGDIVGYQITSPQVEYIPPNIGFTGRVVDAETFRLDETGNIFINEAERLRYKEFGPTGFNDTSYDISELPGGRVDENTGIEFVRVDPIYTLKVQAIDSTGLLSPEATVEINIADVNESETIVSAVSVGPAFIKDGFSYSYNPPNLFPIGVSRNVTHVATGIAVHSYSQIGIIIDTNTSSGYKVINAEGANFSFERSWATLYLAWMRGRDGGLFPIPDGNGSTTWELYRRTWFPVALDLDDDGLSWSSINFDIDSDGLLEETPWTDPNDGLLVLDRDNNGLIDNGSEISFVEDLPGATTDLEGLAAYDTNNDGLLDSRDADFGKFQVWQDQNQNGVSEASELKTLAEQGIQSINLQPVPNSEPSGAADVEVLNTGSFTRTDGSTGALGDVAFTYTDIDPDSAAAKPLALGTDQDDTLIGLIGADNIDMLDGNDRVFGGRGDDRIQGGLGNDVVAGEEGNDELHGGAGDDNIGGGLGDDRLHGDAGEDIMFGGEGQDLLYGGSDNDILLGEQGDDRLFGDAGDDRLIGAEGKDFMQGGEGNDQLDGGIGDDVLLGNAGDDILFGGEGNDILAGESGNDIIHGGAGENHVWFAPGDGVDQLADIEGTYVLNLLDVEPADIQFIENGSVLIVDIANAGGSSQLHIAGYRGEGLFDAEPSGTLNLVGINFYSEAGELNLAWDRAQLIDQLYAKLNPVIEGSLGDDILEGTLADDLIEGLSGNDMLYGQGGDDEIYGHSGSDQLNGGEGNDILDGGLANDLLNGDAGADELYGQSGNDQLNGGEGNDSLFGGDDNDVLNGGEGDDQLQGQAGHDILSGGEGLDVLDGGRGDDLLQGGIGNDELFGGLGDDTLEGNAGDDFLEGGAGNDELSGAEGSDIINAGTGDDIATGGAGVDVLVGELGNDRLSGGSEDDALYGDAGQDTLFGDAGDDILSGGKDNDILVGGEGNDLLQGGEGNNTIRFHRGDGQDTVVAGDVSVERYEIEIHNITPQEVHVVRELIESEEGTLVTLTLDFGQGDSIRFEGYDLDNPSTSSINALRFIVLDDDGNTIELIVDGDDLNDQILNATIRGTDGDDTLIGTANDDNIEALAGNDIIDGRAGIDTMTGGEGDDTYYVDNTQDQIVEQNAEGTDSVYASANYTLSDHVENLTLIDNAISGVGNALDNFIMGNAENNILDGGLGADQLIGGSGDDTYVVDSLGDFIIELTGDGIDTVEASLDYRLDFNLENLTLTHNAVMGEGNTEDNVIIGNEQNNQLFGHEGNDTLISNSGNDVLDGGVGADRMLAGQGDDIYIVDNHLDETIELTGDGTDTVFASVNWTLAENIENLNLVGDAEQGIGNDLDNHLQGHDGHNILKGGLGNDILQGGKGHDILDGGKGQDLIHFGRGDGIDVALQAEGSYLLNLIDISPQDLTIDVDASEGKLYLKFGEGDQIIFEGFDVLDSEDTLPIEEIRFHYDGQELVKSRQEISDLVETSLATKLGTDKNDWLIGSRGDDRIAGFAGHDRIWGNHGDDVILGGSGNDRLRGGRGDDRLLGGADDDYLHGGHGDDSLDGGTGDDTLYGSIGDDRYTFNLGDGSDYIRDGWGDDRIVFGKDINYDDLSLENRDGDLVIQYSDAGDEITLHKQLSWFRRSVVDTVEFADGQETSLSDLLTDKVITTYGSDHWDWIRGTEFNDSVFAGKGDDIVWGDNGDDSLDAEQGDDFIDGGKGDDTLSGGEGDDILKGGDGNDKLAGNAGNDYLRGGKGEDTYYFSLGDGQDKIFNSDRYSEDKLVISGVEKEALSFTKVRRDLVIGISGTEDQITIDDWYRHDRYQVETIQVGDDVITNDMVDQLVQSMASFGAGQGSDLRPTQEEEYHYAPNLAIAW